MQAFEKSFGIAPSSEQPHHDDTTEASSDNARDAQSRESQETRKKMLAAKVMPMIRALREAGVEDRGLRQKIILSMLRQERLAAEQAIRQREQRKMDEAAWEEYGMVEDPKGHTESARKANAAARRAAEEESQRRAIGMVEDPDGRVEAARQEARRRQALHEEAQRRSVGMIEDPTGSIEAQRQREEALRREVDMKEDPYGFVEERRQNLKEKIRKSGADKVAETMDALAAERSRREKAEKIAKDIAEQKKEKLRKQLAASESDDAGLIEDPFGDIEAMRKSFKEKKRASDKEKKNDSDTDKAA